MIISLNCTVPKRQLNNFLIVMLCSLGYKVEVKVANKGSKTSPPMFYLTPISITFGNEIKWISPYDGNNSYLRTSTIEPIIKSSQNKTMKEQREERKQTIIDMINLINYDYSEYIYIEKYLDQIRKIMVNGKNLIDEIVKIENKLMSIYSYKPNHKLLLEYPLLINEMQQIADFDYIRNEKLKKFQEVINECICYEQ